MMNDGWLMMDDGLLMMDVGWRMMDDGWWIMDDGWWMMDESTESTECTEAPLLWLKRKSWFSRRNMEKSTKS